MFKHREVSRTYSTSCMKIKHIRTFTRNETADIHVYPYPYRSQATSAANLPSWWLAVSGEVQPGHRNHVRFSTTSSSILFSDYSLMIQNRSKLLLSLIHNMCRIFELNLVQNYDRTGFEGLLFHSPLLKIWPYSSQLEVQIVLTMME